MRVPFCFCGLMLVTWLFPGQFCHAGQLYIVSLKTGEIRQLTNDDSLGYGCPDWSPDSKRIALDASPVHMDFLQSKIVIVDYDGGAQQDLSPGAMPDWSPDGKQLVCHQFQPSDEGFRTTQIVLVDIKGTGREAILEGWGSPRWGPDGQSVVTEHQGGLARLDFATGEQTVFLSGKSGKGISPGFSYSSLSQRYCVPTGGPALAIVEKNEATGEWELRERYSKGLPWDLNGYNRDNVIGRTSWALDGNRIVFAVGDPQTNRRLLILNADDTLPPTEVPGLPADWICCNPSWSPDGEWIAFIRVVPADKEEEE